MPEYECREAAAYVHVSWKEWLEVMDARERASAVAHYRANYLIKAHVEDASSTASEHARRRNNTPARGASRPRMRGR